MLCLQIRKEKEPPEAKMKSNNTFAWLQLAGVEMEGSMGKEK